MTTSNTPDHAAPRRKFWTLARRRWAYGIAVAAAPLAVLYGLVTAEQSAAMLVLAAAVLGMGGLALQNPTTE